MFVHIFRTFSENLRLRLLSYSKFNLSPSRSMWFWWVEYNADRPGGVRTTTAMHCGFKIFKMAAKVEKFRRLYALFFNRYSSFASDYEQNTPEYTYQRNETVFP